MGLPKGRHTAVTRRHAAGVFLGKLRPMPAGLAQWRFRTPARPAGGSTCYLQRLDARCFFLSQLPSLESCNLADDSIVSLSPLGCAAAAAAPLSSHRSPPPTPSASVPRRRSQGSRRRTWRLGRPGTARWWPHRPARSCQRAPSRNI